VAPDGLRPAWVSKWAAIAYATGSWARTIRLCVIVLAIGIASAIPFAVADLVRGWLG